MDVKTDFPDGLARCAWLDHSALYRTYHDDEWGVPQGNDRLLFEQLSLEGFQAGLSWRTILDKREAFRRAFSNFDIEQVASYDEQHVLALLADKGIVRHRGKIQAVINNAKQAIELREKEGSLAAFFWRFAPEPSPMDASSARAAGVVQSAALSKALKKMGWNFVGPTTVYAFMQAVGMVNDHSLDCHKHASCQVARANFVAPS